MRKLSLFKDYCGCNKCEGDLVDGKWELQGAKIITFAAMQVHRDIAHLPAFRRAVLTVGSFDGVHRGHRAILRRLKAAAGYYKGESVVISFTPHPRQVLTGEQVGLLHSEDEKIESLASLGVDHLVLVPFDKSFAEQPAEAYVRYFLLARFRPRAIVLGFDHRFGAGRRGDIALLRAIAGPAGVEVIEIPAHQVASVKISSTQIRRALAAGDVRTANELLCAPYRLRGTVVAGNRLGRQIGFPTANIRSDDPDKIIPADGVYVVRVYIGGQSYGGMLHIGNRPTLPSVERRIEVHVFDFEGDLYGRTITVEWVDRIRDNRQFDDLAKLSAQLEQDKQAALERLNAKSMTASVVILNYNGKRHLENYLPSVLAYTPDDVRIIVADNASTDDSLSFLEDMQRQHPRIEVIRLPRNYGFAGGYNEALKQVHSDIYILLNSDVRVTKDWTVPLLDAMCDPDLSVCQPKIKSDLEPERFEYAGASGGYLDFLGYPFCRGRIFGITEDDHGQYDDEVEIFWATGAAMVIRSELFWSFKGFDETFFAHSEEIDLCWQMRRAGYKIKVIPASTVYHLGGGTLSYNTPGKVYLNFRNNLKMLVKNDRARNLAWKLPVRLVMDGLAAFLFLVQGQFRLIYSVLRAHLAFYACLPQLVRRRRAIRLILQELPKERVKSPAGIYPHSIVWQYFVAKRRKFSELKGTRLNGGRPLPF